MRIHYLAEEPALYGRHSGYQLLCSATGEQCNVEVVLVKRSRWRGLLGLAAGAWLPRPEHRWHSLAGAELVFFLNSHALRADAVHHVLVYEQHHHLWQRWRKAPANLITTLHASEPQRLPRPQLENLSRVSSLLVLSSNELEFLEARVGVGRVRFVRHGVDVEFFRPGAGWAEPRRLLFIGRINRDLAMLARVIRQLLGSARELVFDLVLTGVGDNEELRTLLGHSAVRVHHGVSDEQLRDLYQRAYLLLLPLTHTSANNSIVEAMASGLPPVTCDVGGIRDYGGGSLFPVVPAGADEAMVALIERYLDDCSWRDRVGRAVRAFAECELGWPVAARAHLDAYAALCGDGTESR